MAAFIENIGLEQKAGRQLNDILKPLECPETARDNAAAAASAARALRSSVVKTAHGAWSSKEGNDHTHCRCKLIP